MNAQPVTHPAPEQLSAFGLGKLHETAAAAVAKHLADCATCRKALAGLPGDSFVGMVRAAKVQATVAPSSPTPAPKDKLTPPQPAAPPPELPPELAKHAKYRIRRELGRGGMGVVYQAEHIQMERLVAIKVINKSILDHPQALERFAREVKAAAKLSHANIVAAYDFEQAGDLHMLVMEFVEGQNLADIVERKGPLPILNACHYMRQAALGLQHAFEKGMVHRDLKPQNMMLTPKGTVKLLDMGLARVASDQAGLTGTGATLGTPEYIAPEQAMDSAKADIRSDIYSLGCTLYCLLAGRPPFADGSAMQKILGHLEKEPQPLPELRPELPAPLAAVVARMMAKDPAQRYQKPVEVAQALAPFCKAVAKGVVTAPAPVAKPVTPVALPPAPPTMAAGSSAVRWDTLTDDGVKDSVLPAKKKTQKVGSRPAGLGAKKKWLIGGAAAGVALLTFLVLLGLVGLWASGVFKVKTKDGTIVLENLPPDADVTVDGEAVTVTPADGKTFTVRVDASKKKHQVEVKKDGFKVFGDEVEVDAGGRKSVLVRLEPKEKPADRGPTKIPDEKELPKTVTVDLDGGVKMEFVLIPKGKFLMGSPLNEPERAQTKGFDPERQHDVEISKPFYLAKYPVTQEQYQALMKEKPSYFQTGNTNKVQGLDTKQFPVETVSWDDAQAFCKKMREHDKQGRLFRLPTEAEWEYACRAERKTTYYFGNDVKDLGENAWYHENSDGRTHQVGSRKPNNWGLYDMHGNVLQWCEDYLGPYNDDLKATDPWRSVKYLDERRVLRGGSWGSAAKLCRAACRDNGAPNNHGDNRFGFRVALVVSDKASEVPSDDPDRKAAEYVLSIGGVVRVNDEVDDIKVAADLPQQPFRLTYVNLAGNPKVRNAGLAAFDGCKNLTVLRINETPLKDQGLAYFKDCKNLEILAVHGTEIGDAGLANFKGCTKVQELHLNFTKATDVGLAYFSGCENLRVLELFRAPVTGEFLTHFKDCSKLEVLELEGTRFDDAALAHLQNCKNLVDLRLLATQVTDKGMVYLKDCKNLKTLGLAATTVGDEGLANFNDFKNLTYLRLHATQMTDKGLAYFKGCDKLEKLEQRGSKVTKAGLDDFRKAHPKCWIDLQPDWK